jgi:putative hydrolase of the HAD superfamily
MVVKDGPMGPWSRWERGEIDFDDFVNDFKQRGDKIGINIDMREIVGAISSTVSVRPEMVRAIQLLKQHGFLVGAITNNWKPTGSGSSSYSQSQDQLRSLFHVFIESSETGVRKPDPAIFQIALDAINKLRGDRMECKPSDCLFLDDIGLNCKAGRTFGFTCIHVKNSRDALKELSAIVKVNLLDTSSKL